MQMKCVRANKIRALNIQYLSCLNKLSNQDLEGDWLIPDDITCLGFRSKHSTNGSHSLIIDVAIRGDYVKHREHVTGVKMTTVNCTWDFVIRSSLRR